LFRVLCGRVGSENARTTKTNLDLSSPSKKDLVWILSPWQRVHL